MNVNRIFCGVIGGAAWALVFFGGLPPIEHMGMLVIANVWTAAVFILRDSPPLRTVTPSEVKSAQHTPTYLPDEPLTYLASPHSHPDPQIRQERWERVVEYAAVLMADGHRVFCPIAHTHHIGIYITEHFENCNDFDYWVEYDKAMIRRCDRLVVYKLDGWEQSKGVAAEIAFARELGLQVDFHDPTPPEATP